MAEFNLSDYFLKDGNNLVIGYYGGGNFGDELLMEILMAGLNKEGLPAFFIYLDQTDFLKLHQSFEKIKLVNGFSFFKKTLTSKNIIFGGGGLFSEDSTYKHFLILIYLFFIKLILRKKIYFLGIGFYKNNSILLKIAPFLIKNLATKILTRDKTSYEFLVSKKTLLYNDLAFLLNKYDFSSNYRGNIKITKRNDPLEVLNLETGQKIVVFSFRGPKNKEIRINNYENFNKIIKENPQIKFVFWEMSNICYSRPDSEEYLNIILSNQNVYLLKFENNPLEIFYFFKKYYDKFIFITPQFHGVITAYLNNIPFLPVYYAQKSKDFFNKINLSSTISINKINQEDITQFILKHA